MVGAKGWRQPKIVAEKISSAVSLLWQNPEYRERMRKAHLGQKAWNKGIELDYLKGDGHWNWKGGVSQENYSERKNTMGTLRYKTWRKEVFDRDDFTCQICGIRGAEMHADHIKPYGLFPELRFELSNGRTLCVLCHRETETWGARIFKKSLNQLIVI